jgi:small GTP-binding protein
MGQLISNTPKPRVVMLGLDGSGKTTLLYQLRLGEVVSTIPTIGYNVETIEIDKNYFTVWDLGGQDRIRPLWNHYLSNLDSLIFVIDSTDHERILEAKCELDKLFAMESLFTVPLLIFCNKQDLPRAMSVMEITEKLELHCKKVNWMIQACCAVKQEGLREGFNWLASKLPKDTSFSAKKILDTMKSVIENFPLWDVFTSLWKMISTVWRRLFSAREARALILGLDAAGKTTILYKLKLGVFVSTIPTIGFNVETVETRKMKFTIWDVGGIDRIRPLWRHYFQGINCLIFVIDSNDRERFPQAKEELDKLLKNEELKNIPVLIFCNKQDLPNVMSVSEICEMLELRKLTNTWKVQASCGVTGEGLDEGLGWLASNLLQ